MGFNPEHSVEGNRKSYPVVGEGCLFCFGETGKTAEGASRVKIDKLVRKYSQNGWIHAMREPTR